MAEGQWTEVGEVEELRHKPLQEVMCGKTAIALSYKDGAFAAISGVCNHVGGPLGEGRLEGDYVVCPWHYWKFHCKTGQGESGYDQDQVPAYATKIRTVGSLSICRRPRSERSNRTYLTRWLVLSSDNQVRFVSWGYLRQR